MALLTRRPDGALLVETRLDYFLERWKTAGLKDRIVLEDKRPAVRSIAEDGISLTTIHPEMWGRVRAYIKPLLKAGELKHPSRKRLCELCGAELKLVREMTDTWVFTCDACHTSEIHGKHLIGGTIGAGTKEKI